MSSIELTPQEIEDILEDIFSASKAVEFDDEFYVLKHPSLKDASEARLVYRMELKRAAKAGFLSIKSAEELVQKKKLFTEEDEAKIEKIKASISDQKKVLSVTFRVPARRDRLLGIIEGLEKELVELESKRYVFNMHTQEYKAKEKQYNFLMRRNIYLPSGNELVWKTDEEFDEDCNRARQIFLYTAFAEFARGIPTKVLRYVARNPHFRLRYQNCIKTHAEMFDRSVSEYTVDMLNLLYWANYYQSIYEMMPDDAPPDAMLDDDEALDAYMEVLYKERSQARASARGRSKNSTGKIKSSFDQNEVIVMKSNEMYQDVKYDKPKFKSGAAKGSDVKVDGKGKEARPGKK